MKVHIKSGELCERCAYGIERCMEKWDEDGIRCDGCRMNRGRKGAFADCGCLRRDSSVAVLPQNDTEGSTDVSGNEAADGDRAKILRCAQDDTVSGAQELPEHICVCDEIADGGPCEFFEEVEEA